MPYPYFKSLYNRLFSREYATHRARLDREFTTAIARSHERAESEGHDSLALGSESTVDLMIGKGGGVDRDGLTDQEIKDELLTCEWMVVVRRSADWT